MQADMIGWWRAVAASRALQARARELADQLSAELAQAMAATGTAEPELAAALAVAAYRTVHLQAIRAILAGEDAATVAAGPGGSGIAADQEEPAADASGRKNAACPRRPRRPVDTVADAGSARIIAGG